jgi:hypothetical protein
MERGRPLRGLGRRLLVEELSYRPEARPDAAKTDHEEARDHEHDFDGVPHVASRWRRRKLLVVPDELREIVVIDRSLDEACPRLAVGAFELENGAIAVGLDAEPALVAPSRVGGRIDLFERDTPRTFVRTGGSVRLGTRRDSDSRVETLARLAPTKGPFAPQIRIGVDRRMSTRRTWCNRTG